MSGALTGLNQIPGVIGSAIFNADDQCVVHMMPSPFDASLLVKVMAEVRNALNVLTYLDEQATWSSIVVRYEAGYLMVRSVQQATVMVLAQPSLNPAMLSVGFNVAALKLEKEGIPTAPAAPPPLRLPLPPPPSPSSRAATVPGVPAVAGSPAAHGHAPPAPPAAAQRPQATPLPVAPSSLSLSQSGGGTSTSVSQSGRTPLPSLSQSSPPGAHVSQSSPRLASASTSLSAGSSADGHVVADAVGRPVIEALLKALAKHIGPFAKLIMKEELTKLGVTSSTLGFSQYDDFVGLLGRRLQDPLKRREFMTEAEALPSKR